jgi:hypothetical protein
MRPPHLEGRYSVYIYTNPGDEGALVVEHDTLAQTLTWLAEHTIDMRRMRHPHTPAIGEIFDWQDGSTTWYWIIV